MVVHQCAKYSNDPQVVHERDFRKIGKYLSKTDMRGIIYDPGETQGIECYVDMELSGVWDRDEGQRADNFLSRSGFFISYASCCTILCARKLQTEIALSTAKAEYIALSTSLR